MAGAKRCVQVLKLTYSFVFFAHTYSSFREVTENIEVTVTTFYLGSSMSGGQLRHMWRYVIR